MEIHNEEPHSSEIEYQTMRLGVRGKIVKEGSLFSLFSKKIGEFSNVAPVITYTNDGNARNRAKEIEQIIRDGDGGRVDNAVVVLNTKKIPAQAYKDVRRTDSIQIDNKVQMFRHTEDEQKK